MAIGPAPAFDAALEASRRGLRCIPAGAVERALIDGMLAEALAADLPADIAAALADAQAGARRTAYQSRAAGGEALIACDGAPVGYWWVGWQPAAIRLVDVGLRPAARGRGLGSAVLAALCAAGDELGLPIMLSVAPANPVQRLYRRLGFHLDGPPAAILALRRPPRAPGRTPADADTGAPGAP